MLLLTYYLLLHYTPIQVYSLHSLFILLLHFSQLANIYLTKTYTTYSNYFQILQYGLLNKNFI